MYQALSPPLKGPGYEANFFYAGVAPFEKKFTVEVFAGQRFESEVCTAKDGLSPIWSINGTRLIDRDVIDSFNAHVPRNTNNGLRQATLILSLVNSAFNDSVLLCSTNLTQILAYKMFVGEYT